jgi:peptide-methionine (S)-S-oxide reductase
VVRVRFDPSRISLREILEIFFAIHDPTTLNRQGHDVGTQYRSGIFVHDTDQERVARAMIAELTAAGVWKDPIVTEVAPVDNYWPAEPYHQDYFLNHPNQGYCAYVVAPKVEKFCRTFADKVRRG